MPSARTPLSASSGRRWRGSPESEDLPVALHTDPLAEGGIVAKRLVLLVVRLVRAARDRARGDRPRARRRQDADALRPDRGQPSRRRTHSTRSSRRRSLGEFYYHVTSVELRPVRRPGRPLRRHRVSGWVFKVERRLAARRRRQGRAEGRRSRALVLRDLRPDGRPADARGEGRAKRGATPRRPSTTTARRRRVDRPRLPRRLEAHDQRRDGRTSTCPGPHPGVLVRATATGAVRSNAVK